MFLNRHARLMQSAFLQRAAIHPAASIVHNGQTVQTSTARQSVKQTRWTVDKERANAWKEHVQQSLTSARLCDVLADFS